MNILTKMNDGTHQNEAFVFFWGSYLSNWANTPFEMLGEQFNCSEHAFMYHKAMVFEDIDTAAEILKESDPREQKKLGRSVKGFDDRVWNNYKFDIMIEVLMYKFEQNETLKKQLLATDNKIIAEASPVDKIWGIGMDVYDINILDQSKWKGQNLLGKALMAVREMIK